MLERREGWGLVVVKRGEGEGGVTATPNLRHVWVRLGEYRRVWEEGREALPTSEAASLGARAAEVWPCAPAQLSLSRCRPGDVGRGGREGGRGGVTADSKSRHNDCSLCCGLASKASAATHILRQDRGGARKRGSGRGGEKKRWSSG